MRGDGSTHDSDAYARLSIQSGRTSEARACALVEPFLAEREPWLRRHVARHAAATARIAAAGPVRDGALLRYRGEPHRVCVVAGSPGARPAVDGTTAARATSRDD